MAIKRMKHDRGTVLDQEPVLEDRISELPIDVLMNIVCRLPTIAAVRMSVLSTRWRRVWTRVPVIDIDEWRDGAYLVQYNRKRIDRNKVARFAKRCLSVYPFPETQVLIFKLRMSIIGGSDSWLKQAVMKNVKVIELRIGYALPQFVLNLEWLSRMTLQSVVLKTKDKANLPSLIEIDLKFVTIDDLSVENLLSGCASLKKLSMSSCHGFVNPKFSSSSLKEIVFTPEYRSSHPIRLNVVSLRSFVFNGGRIENSKNGLDLARCVKIRDISLSGAILDDAWFEVCIPNLTLLESLKLTDCFGMRRMRICSPSLKCFVLDSEQRSDSIEVKIDAPSLEHFSYSGASLFGISVRAQNLLRADIRIRERGRKTNDREWYASLIEFLSAFNECPAVHLYLPSELAVLVPAELGQPCPDLRHLKLKIPNKAFHRRKT